MLATFVAGQGFQDQGSGCSEECPWSPFHQTDRRRNRAPLQFAVVSNSPEEAAKHFAALNGPASSERARALMDWQPSGPGLIANLDRPSISRPEN
jgi:hypothetical protein